ncbi:MAG: NUDIX domain-containing protein [Lactobacillus sp.]|jgi:isopentenyldiphosphate isomerase|nr:NUDIX domain-containing protein [Lactobacillus sp.]
MEEKIDVYDAFGNKTGRIISSRFELEDDEYFFGVHAWIINSKGQVLIQKRAETKKVMPGMWSINGGGALSGEASIDACVREVKEEIGVDIDKKNAFLMTEKGGPDEWKCWLDVYFIRQDIDIKDVKVDKTEVADAKWVETEDILEMMDKGEFFAVDIVRNAFTELLKYMGKIHE